MNSLYHPITSNHLRTDTECRLFQALSLLIFALFSLLSSLFSYLSLHILTNIHYLLIFIPFHFAYQLIYLLLHSHIHKFIISSIHTFTHSVIPGLTRLLTDDKFSPNMFVVSGRSGKVKIFDFRNTNRPIFEFYFFIFLLYFFFPLSSSFY